MMTDDEMGQPLPLVGDFLSFEIDLGYEFDAPQHFDFTREESFYEAWQAQRWFETAGSYPPSPFIARLNIRDVFVENVNTLSAFNVAERSDCLSFQSNVDSTTELSTLNEPSKECKKFVKGPFSRGSTLMKPTASQLAKQNRFRDAKRSQFVHRFQKPSLQKHEGLMEVSSDAGGHASKRQKLDGGYSLKVSGVKEHTELLHKAPQKKSVPVDLNPHQSRLRITIPREPKLETAQRARRQFAQRSRPDDANQSQEGKVPVIPTFKAHPLNRKILEAPSLPLSQKSTPRLPQFQPFHLKTEERALHHGTTSSSLVAKNVFAISTVEAGTTGLKKLQCQPSTPSLPLNVAQKREGCDDMQMKFRARPLDKKILSSKGDIGVFRSTKRDTTKPMEFRLATSKRCQQDPPTELLNKLSINADIHQTSASHTALLWPSRGVNKDWKENVNCTLQQGHKQMQLQTSKEELNSHEIKHIGFESSAITDYRSRTNKPRQSWGIR